MSSCSHCEMHAGKGRSSHRFWERIGRCVCICTPGCGIKMSSDGWEDAGYLNINHWNLLNSDLYSVNNTSVRMAQWSNPLTTTQPRLKAITSRSRYRAQPLTSLQGLQREGRGGDEGITSIYTLYVWFDFSFLKDAVWAPSHLPSAWLVLYSTLSWGHG